MALVRISKALLTDVQSQMRAMRAHEINEIKLLASGGPISAIGRTDITDFIRERLWGEHASLAPLLPPQWCVKVGKLNLRVDRKVHLEGKTPPPQAQASLAYLNLKLLAPPGTSVISWDDSRLDYSISFEDLPKGTKLHEEFTHELDAADQRGEVATTWAFREVNITQFLNKCKSLNEAIKLWEGVKLYIPKSYLDDVERTVVINRATQRKEQVTKGLDSEGLTAAAIAAKLAGIV